ncbi:MAG: cyclopropane-fatty-acyl-phospholipid synthase family protein [Verrucomicrobiota bacterium]|nr:cyclopropane-fatty-acyl-phospholipid synthase family protein [Verrucomicrobiota bacterium]
MDPSKQDSLTGTSQHLATKFQSNEIVPSKTPGMEAKFDRASPLGGDSRVLPASAKSVPWKRLRLLERFFVWTLRNLHGGTLEITFPSGVRAFVGDRSFPLLQLKINKPNFFIKVLSGGSISFGEAYVEGDWSTHDLSGLLLLLAKNQKDLGRINRGFSILAKQANRIYHKARRNTTERSKKNIQAHYDLSNDFYQTFLDPSMTYSSALFQSLGDSLEQAQLNKIDRMLDLADVGEGDTILEIGSGWGALALRASRRGCRVKTITLSEEQFAYAKDLFEREGVSDRVEIVLEDYRIQTGQYDAVISCEMIEAVGREYLDNYFHIVSQSLKPKARAVIQAITIPDERYESYSRSCDWIQKHIFPGGHLPSPSAISEHLASAGEAAVIKMEAFGHDYAETLRRWSASFNAAKSSVDALGFDESFRRKWNYYFSYCEAGFDADLIEVQHIVIEKN